jgi:hypothetical protein
MGLYTIPLKRRFFKNCLSLGFLESFECINLSERLLFNGKIVYNISPENVVCPKKNFVHYLPREREREMEIFLKS